jgi:prevent-host-death family protein
VDEIAISKFKATCLAVLHRVQRTGRPVLVTRFGRPVAEIVAPASARGAKRDLGALAGTAEIVGDVLSPVFPAEAWESERKAG